MRAGDHGLQGAQVNIDDAVVHRIGVAGQRNIVLLSSLGCQECPGGLVGGEDGRRGAQLRAHVGDGAPLGDGQGCNAWAPPFNDGAHAALDGQDPQQFQGDVLGGDIGVQGACQIDLEHLGHGDVIRPTAHGHGHIQAAGTKGQHTDAAAGGGMAVGADEGLAGFAEAL